MAVRRRKKRTHVRAEADTSKKGAPKSFVFRRGRFGGLLKGLESDLRDVMRPNTALNLRESKRNVLKDFVSVSGPLGVTHFLILSATQHASYLRVAKTPRGPTLTCRIQAYSRVSDVQAAQRKPRFPRTAFLNGPLLVMNNFGQAEHMKLATVLFQNLFPAINVNTVKLSNCRRVVLLNYVKETNTIQFRHYMITAQPVGVTKAVKKLVQRKGVPDMGDLQDISEFVSKQSLPGYNSESELEDPSAQVELAQELAGGNLPSRQSAIRLHELGPRMELEVVKAEAGLCGGAVLYHALVEKSVEEKAATEARVAERERLRKERRSEQEANVRRKREEQRRKQEEQEAKRRRRDEEGDAGGAGRAGPRRSEWDNPEDGEADDDAAWYRDEVEEEPEEGLGTEERGGRGGRGGRGRGFGRGRGGRGFGGGRGGARGRGGRDGLKARDGGVRKAGAGAGSGARGKTRGSGKGERSDKRKGRGRGS